MSRVLTICRRTAGLACSLYSTALAFGLFFAAGALSFAFSLEMAEGSQTPLAVAWTSAVAPVLPVLAALLAMDAWSEERRSGRIDSLLTVAVRERVFTAGKFLGVYSLAMAATLGLLVSTLAMLYFFAPATLGNQHLVSFAPGLFALALQGALWCALSLAASAMCRHAAAAALASIALTVALPRGLWFALMEWAPQGRMAFGEMPLDAHAYDLASGVVSTSTVLSYAILACFALFCSSKATASLRLAGRGARALRASTALTIALAAALAFSLLALVQRVSTTFELEFLVRGDNGFSARTRNILADSRGEISITAFLSRKDARFRPLVHFLRTLAGESEAVGGARLSVRYVDPRWDIGPAERLVRAGAREDSLIFERGRRRAILPLAGGFDERMCASALLRLATRAQRGVVYWTTGHGECQYTAYEPWGMSEIARNISHCGYRNMPLDFASASSIPDDCALVVIAGAKSDLSRAETARLDAYLRKGGRLLVLLAPAETAGLASMLSAWGIKTSNTPLAGARTLTGTDAIIGDFSEHPVAAPLEGSQIVLEKPLVLRPSAAADIAGADRVEYSELARAGEACVAAAAERGAGTGDDLALRPTRIIAVGDAAFVMNGQLKIRGNANRDFFLNAVAYLAGTDAITEAGTEAGRLVTGMDRAEKVRFVVASAIVLPGALFALLAAAAAAKRRRP